MQKYNPKSRIASIADHMLSILATIAIGMAWFVFLWGIQLASLVAGIAFGVLIWLGVRQFIKKSVARKEKTMRQLLGGELAIRQLLLLSPHQAVLEAAQWIFSEYPIQISKTRDWSLIGTLNDHSVYLRIIVQHESTTITAQQIVVCLRDMHSAHLKQGILCLTAPAEQTALHYVSQAAPDVVVIRREELIRLAGTLHPATDEDLLSQRSKQKRYTFNQWIDYILVPERSQRYFWYGIGLSFLAILTGEWFYPFPAAACLILYVLSRYRSLKRRPNLL